MAVSAQHAVQILQVKPERTFEAAAEPRTHVDDFDKNVGHLRQVGPWQGWEFEYKKFRIK